METEKINDLILVTGAERSGSSIVAKIIGLCGASIGEVDKMYENKKVKDVISDYYQSLGIDIKNQYPIPRIQFLLKDDSIDHLLGRILSSIDGNPRMYKSSRSCQIWPVWHRAFPGAKWILVRRRTGDIVNSCLHTAFMHSYSNRYIQDKIGVSSEREAWIWWVHQHERMFADMLRAGLNCKIVWPEKMVTGDFSQMREMVEWLGLIWDDSVEEQVKPMLVNSKINTESL